MADKQGRIAAYIDYLIGSAGREHIGKPLESPPVRDESDWRAWAIEQAVASGAEKWQVLNVAEAMLIFVLGETDG